MPIPKRREGEDKDGYISRCMGDANINTDYPDLDQRAAVCNAQWDKSVKEIADRDSFSMSKNTVEAEVFAVGKWNGLSFTKKDLQGIVDAFNKVTDVHKVPLKFGHNSDQPMTDGQPALGWVSELWVSGNKLMAKFSDVPNVVMNAIRKGLYKRVSIELDRKVKYKSMFFDNLLSGIALLGADIPAVNTLEDLNAFMSRDSIAGGERFSFSVVKGNLVEENKMPEIDELKAQIAKLEVEKDKASFAASKAEQELQSKLDADKEAAENAKAEKIEFNRSQVKEVLEASVKDQLISPAQRDIYSRTLQINDNTAMEHINIDDVKELVGTMKKDDFSSSAHSEGGEESTESGSPDQQLVDKINEAMDKSPDLSFEAAQNQVMRTNKDLTKKYVFSTGTGS